MAPVKKLIPGIMLVVAALLMIGAIYIWAPVCSKFLELKTGKLIYMRCHYSAVAAVILSILMIASAVSTFIMKKNNIIIPVLLGFFLILVIKDTPLSIGICKKATMECQGTKIWFYISGILSILSGIYAWKLDCDEKGHSVQLD